MDKHDRRLVFVPEFMKFHNLASPYIHFTQGRYFFSHKLQIRTNEQLDKIDNKFSNALITLYKIIIPPILINRTLEIYEFPFPFYQILLSRIFNRKRYSKII